LLLRRWKIDRPAPGGSAPDAAHAPGKPLIWRDFPRNSAGGRVFVRGPKTVSCRTSTVLGPRDRCVARPAFDAAAPVPGPAGLARRRRGWPMRSAPGP
jgi:hypothetical protein